MVSAIFLPHRLLRHLLFRVKMWGVAILCFLLDRLFSARSLPALIMASFQILTSPPVLLPLLPSGARALSPCARVRLNKLLLHSFLVRHPRPLGRIPFPFLPSPRPSFNESPSSPHPSPVLASLPIPSPPSHPCLRFLRHFILFFFTFVKSHNVLCRVLS